MFHMRRSIPTGSLLQKPYRDKNGKLKRSKRWHVRYYVEGRRIELPTKTEDRDEALTFLRKKMAESHLYVALQAHPERVRIGNLLDLLLATSRRRERKTTYDTERRIEKKGGLRDYFGQVKAMGLTSTAIQNYVAHRQSQNPRPANATINRELACIRHAMHLGAEQDPPLVLRVPKFEMLPEAEPRDGMLTHDQYRGIRDSLPIYARIALVIGYHTGARKGEIREIRKERIDLNLKRIELRRATTKNKKPRYLPIYGDMAAEIDMAISKGDAKCPWLLQNECRRVYDFEKAWHTACDLAEVPDALFHDLRRVAVTNMIEAGFSEKEAMEISGHRTRAVFDRYHIVSERRLRDMAERLEAHMKAKETVMGTGTGTATEKPC